MDSVGEPVSSNNDSQLHVADGGDVPHSNYMTIPQYGMVHTNGRHWTLARYSENLDHVTHTEHLPRCVTVCEWVNDTLSSPTGDIHSIYTTHCTCQ